MVLFNSVKLDWATNVRDHLKNVDKTVKNTDYAKLIKILFINKADFLPPRIVSSFVLTGRRILIDYRQLKYFFIL